MAFFEAFSTQLGEVSAEIMNPIRAEAEATTHRLQGVYKRTADAVLAAGDYVPITVAGKDVHWRWAEVSRPLTDYIKSLDLPCLRGKMIYRSELSIIPPGGKLEWHHDIYLKDKLCERIHVPIITTPATVFLSKWFTEDDIWAYRMKPDCIYRFNNRVMHAVRNDDAARRIHIMFNYMREDIYEYLSADEDRLNKFDTQIRSVTSDCEAFYYSNPNPGIALKLPNRWPKGEFQAMVDGRLNVEQIQRLLDNTNGDTWSILR